MRWLVLVGLVACGKDPGQETPIDGSSQLPDADESAQCLIRGDYGDLGRMAGNTMQGPTTLTITLDAGPPRDSFFIKLTTGKGVFANGLATGTFSIGGVDASFNDCGLCVNIIADIVTGTGPQKFYFATSGSVTLTSTSPPIGSLQDAQFVEIAFPAGTPVPGGCDGSITRLAFVEG